MSNAGSSVEFTIDDHSHPYTHLDFKNDPDEFHFAVLADNSGSPRPGVVAAGLRMLNLLHPEFVVNLGDLIEGYAKPDDTPADLEQYRDWWAEFDGYVSVLEMPFFYVPGNHDLNNPPSVEAWQERFGGTRQYSHFRYKDTLFLLISTEDPPKDTDKLVEDDPERAQLITEAYHAVKRAVADDEPIERILELVTPIEEYAGEVNISDEQIDYFRQVLEAHSDVRWTFLFMHAPAWWTASGFEQDPGSFAKIEELLADRDYTVFAAHTHTYHHAERRGRDYIIAAMTGALNAPRQGAIDHVIWVTMTKGGPKIANLLLNGILDKYGPVEGDHTVEFGMYQPNS